MKKIILAAALLALASCTHLDRKVKLDFSANPKKSNFGSGIKVDVAVIDERLDKNKIGSKEFCDNKKITLSSAENIADLLKKKISESLKQEGFEKGGERIVEVRIEQFDYKAECGFLGKSDAEISLKISVINSKTNMKVTRNFELKVNGKHFIIPLEATDDKIINDLLEDMMENILENEALLKNLL